MGRFYDSVAEFKRFLLERTLAAHGWNRTKTAKYLGLERTYLQRLIKQFKIQSPPRK